ncbi:MAG: hypothetical protein OXG51_03315 [Gammaproteobacteria bacterium]|nr:hypothetical protein [Gammaproteobacteria bacterium]
MTDLTSKPAQAGLLQWRVSDALGAAIASRTAGSPVSFGSDELTTLPLRRSAREAAFHRLFDDGNETDATG